MTLCEASGVPRWHYLWDGNPAIYRPEHPLIPFRAPYLLTGKGHIPYLEYPYTAETGWRFSQTWKARDHRARLYLTESEFAIGSQLLRKTGPYILIEAAGRDRKNRNRCWPFPQWQELVRLLNESLPWPILQLDHPDADRLAGVGLIENDDFRQACGVLSAARLYIGPEGGLAHAAAALGTPAVILWGGCISCDVLGYPEHVNLVYGHPETPCGSLKPCSHCDEAWTHLTPEYVLRNVHTALGESAVPIASGVH